MNTGKQINAMVIVLFVTLIAIGAYTIWDPFRSDSAADEQVETAVRRGANTFALNCRLCHGDRGEGGALGGRLPQAPALDQDFLRGFENGALSEEALKDAMMLVTNTITCGRVGTFMPTWGAVQGGTLNEEQIRQLTVLITGGGNEGFWEQAQEHADELDAEATGHATVQMPGGAFADNDPELIVSNAAAYSVDQYIRIGAEQLEVRRGIAGTEAVAHERGIAILRDTGITLRGPIEADGSALLVADTTDLTGGEVLQLADEKMRIVLILEDEGEVVVERGVDDTRAVPHESGTSIFRDTGITLKEAVRPDDTLVVVFDSGRFAVGETLQLDDEKMRVLGLIKQERLQITDIPGTGQQLAKDIGRTPDSFIVSGADGIEVGAIIRLDGELMEITAIRDDGDTGTALDTAVSASDTLISVDDPTFFRPEYVFRVGDEHIRVIGAVDTDQTLEETIGRAQTTIFVSGSEGLSTGMVIRMGRELLRITEIQPAFVEVVRGFDGTSAATHTSGAAILKAEVEEDEEPDTGQTLLETTDANATRFVITGTIGMAIDETFRLGDEVVQVTRVEPAKLRVERGADGTDREAHSRRDPIFERNLLNVERGVSGEPASHRVDDPIFLTSLEVKRSVADSTSALHSKAADIFLGHRLTVERGVFGTSAAEHQNGVLVYNFPTAPVGPELNLSACGQRSAGAEPTPTGPAATPEPTPPGALEVTISLTEFAIAVDPATLADGPVVFQIMNDGAIVHNLRVIATDLAPEDLPTSRGSVDEEQLEIVASTSDFAAGGSQTRTVEQLAAGNYVLICNIPGHYLNGMRIGFEVTAQ